MRSTCQCLGACSYRRTAVHFAGTWLNREAVLLREHLERGLRPRAEMLDHLGGGKRAEARGPLVACATGEAMEETRRKEIAGTGGVDHPRNLFGRHRQRAVARDHDAAILAARDDCEPRLAAERRQRGVEIRRLVEAAQLALVGGNPKHQDTAEPVADIAQQPIPDPDGVPYRDFRGNLITPARIADALDYTLAAKGIDSWRRMLTEMAQQYGLSVDDS